MKSILTLSILIGMLPSFSQTPEKIQQSIIPLEQFVGYYDVGVKPNKPIFRSRWYMRDGKLFVIYDSDIDRELEPYENGKLKSNIFLSDEAIEIGDTDSTYYLVLNFENGKLESFKVLRPSSEWPTDLHGYRNERLSEFAIDTEEKLIYTHQTAHFSLEYTALDTALVPKVAATIEEEFARLIQSFELGDFPKTTIRIYPDLETYHNAVLTPGAPKWQMGRAWDNHEIRMLSPSVAEAITGEPTNAGEMILHEFIHCLHLSMIPDTQRAPGWLWEGLALYKGCCQWGESPFELDYMQNGTYPSLKQIEKDRTFQIKYDLGYYLIEFIDSSFGWDQVLDLIKNNGDIKSSLNISVKDFQEQFYTYLERVYKK